MTTIHTRQLQQYTRPTNNNYAQHNLKLATIHRRNNNTQEKQQYTGEQQYTGDEVDE